MSIHSKILKLLARLKKSHPKYNIGRHIATSIDSNNISDLWGMSDEELYFYLVEYDDKLNMDIPHDEDDDIMKIIKDGTNLKYNIEDLMEDEEY